MTDYKLLIKQMESLAFDSADYIPVMANVSALLYHSMEDVNWAGFTEEDKAGLVDLVAAMEQIIG